MISRTPKSAEHNENEFEFQTPTAQIFEDVDNERTPKEEPKDDKYDALAKQLADLQSQMAETQRANMALMTNPSRQNETFVEVKPETVALPDPALDPEGYDRAVGERTRIRLENANRRQAFDNNRKQDLADRVEDLWSSFSEKFPDMADDKEKIDFVSTKIAKEAQRKGIDVERYMFVTQDKFLADVARKYVEVFGEPNSDEDNEDTYEDTSRSRRPAARASSRNSSRRRNRSEEEGMDGRTGGIFGGSDGSGRSARRNRDDDEDNGPSMIDDIQALQKKTGFF